MRAERAAAHDHRPKKGGGDGGKTTHSHGHFCSSWDYQTRSSLESTPFSPEIEGNAEVTHPGGRRGNTVQPAIFVVP